MLRSLGSLVKRQSFKNGGPGSSSRDRVMSHTCRLFFSTTGGRDDEDGKDGNDKSRAGAADYRRRRRELAAKVSSGTNKIAGFDDDLGSDSKTKTQEKYSLPTEPIDPANVSKKQKFVSEALSKRYKVKLGNANTVMPSKHKANPFLSPSAYHVRQKEFDDKYGAAREQFGHDLRRIMLTRKWRESQHVTNDLRTAQKASHAENLDTYEAFKAVLDKDDLFDPDELKEYFQGYPKEDSDADRILKRQHMRRNIKRAAGYIQDNFAMFQEMKLRQFLKDDEYRDALIESGLQLSPNKFSGSQEKKEDDVGDMELDDEIAEKEEAALRFAEEVKEAELKEAEKARSSEKPEEKFTPPSEKVKLQRHVNKRLGIKDEESTESMSEEFEEALLQYKETGDVPRKYAENSKFLKLAAEEDSVATEFEAKGKLNASNESRRSVLRAQYESAQSVIKVLNDKLKLAKSAEDKAALNEFLIKANALLAKVREATIKFARVADDKEYLTAPLAEEDDDDEEDESELEDALSLLVDNEEYSDFEDDDEIPADPRNKSSAPIVIQKHVFAAPLSANEDWSHFINAQTPFSPQLDEVLNHWNEEVITEWFCDAIEKKRLHQSLSGSVDPLGAPLDGADWITRFRAPKTRKGKYLDDPDEDLEYSEDEEGWQDPVFRDPEYFEDALSQDTNMTFTEMERRFGEQEFQSRIDAEFLSKTEDTSEVDRLMQAMPDYYLVKNLSYNEQRVALGFKPYNDDLENPDEDDGKLVAPDDLMASWQLEALEQQQKFYFYNASWLPKENGYLDGRATNLYKTYAWNHDFLFTDEWDPDAIYKSDTELRDGVAFDGKVTPENEGERKTIEQRKLYWDAVAEEIQRRIENEAEPPCEMQEMKLRWRADMLLKDRFKRPIVQKLVGDTETRRMSVGKGSRKSSRALCTIRRLRTDVPASVVKTRDGAPALGSYMPGSGEVSSELESVSLTTPAKLATNIEDHLIPVPKSVESLFASALGSLKVIVKPPVAVKNVLNGDDDDIEIEAASVLLKEKKKPKEEEKKPAEEGSAAASKAESPFMSFDMAAAYDAEFDAMKYEYLMAEPEIPSSNGGRHFEWNVDTSSDDAPTRNGGLITVNGKTFAEYFQSPIDRLEVMAPLIECGVLGEFDVNIEVMGGGNTGQAQAAKLALARAIQNQDPTLFRPWLKKQGLLRTDTRVVERKKPGHKKARKSFQWVKR